MFRENLIAPFENGAETLLIVSGYASANLVYDHFEEIKQSVPKRAADLKIELTIGMCVKDGLPKSVHEGFLGLVKGDYKDQFVCRYVVTGAPVHTKLYVWLLNDVPSVGFAGSANYTQQAFMSGQREILKPCDPEDAKRYFDRIKYDTLLCTDDRIPELINIHEDLDFRGSVSTPIDGVGYTPSKAPVRISLLANNGSLPAKSGLNWGQRPNREPNQAYIRVPMSIARTGFFPETGRHFTLLTDDGESMVCVRAQQGGKAIETPSDNSLLGLYFRKRMRVPAGEPVTKQHVESYGRTYIEVHLVDEETYWMDFSN